MWPIDMVHHFMVNEPWILVFILVCSAVFVYRIRVIFTWTDGAECCEERVTSGVLFLFNHPKKRITIILPGQKYTLDEGCEEIEIFPDTEALHAYTREEVGAYVLEQYLRHVKNDEEVITRYLKQCVRPQLRKNLFPFDEWDGLVMDVHVCEAMLANAKKDADVVLLSMLHNWHQNRNRKHLVR